MYVRAKISTRGAERSSKTLKTFDETCNLLTSSFKGDYWDFPSPFVLFALQSRIESWTLAKVLRRSKEQKSASVLTDTDNFWAFIDLPSHPTYHCSIP